jgi:hypothetical protein
LIGEHIEPDVTASIASSGFFICFLNQNH